jgi:hypothetical protein
MTTFPSLIRSVSASGGVRYALGDLLVDRYLEFVAGRPRPNTLRAVAFDLTTFFTLIAKDPVGIVAADVFEFLAHQSLLQNRRAPLRVDLGVVEDPRCSEGVSSGGSGSTVSGAAGSAGVVAG